MKWIPVFIKVRCFPSLRLLSVWFFFFSLTAHKVRLFLRVSIVSHVIAYKTELNPVSNDPHSPQEIQEKAGCKVQVKNGEPGEPSLVIVYGDARAKDTVKAIVDEIIDGPRYDGESSFVNVTCFEFSSNQLFFFIPVLPAFQVMTLACEEGRFSVALSCA